MDSFNDWLTSWANTPSLWIMAGFAALFGLTLLILQSVKPTPRRKVIDANWLGKNYPFVVFGAVATLLAAATTFYLFEMGLIVGRAVNILGDEIADGEIEPEDFRNYAYGIAAFVGVLAASATLFFQPIRLWLNERSAQTAEQGMITDRINKAVEGLGAEKTIKVARTQDGQEQPAAEMSVPNLEVRIGSLFSLERIAKDSLRDHVQIMEMISAYVRSNASLPDTKNASDSPPSRPDIQTAVRVMGRRSPQQIETERVQSFYLDLSYSYLGNLDFSLGNFEGASFLGSNLCYASFYKSNLARSSFHSCYLFGSVFGQSDLSNARISHCDVTLAHFAGASVQGLFTDGTDMTMAASPVEVSESLPGMENDRTN
ncbi:pentapeptide repeat-containing protein [Shimia ponticola]|uniref:pentapeptide repeat-containing protein n=1 Tax=Shimia ponticola TaxID=2582893 RepID=UPI0011BE3179|nr:pentapeptide repeat-containing protein [Shimia ponticola]